MGLLSNAKKHYCNSCLHVSFLHTELLVLFVPCGRTAWNILSLPVTCVQVIRGHRLEREADYAAQREREWEQAMAEEALRHRSTPLPQQHSLAHTFA